KNLPMEFAPGTKWNYNNSGYFLLGYIIEKVSGKTYREYIEQNMFEPAGMTSSLYGNDAKIIENRAYGYEPNGDRPANAEYISMLLPYSAGALMTTVEDLYKWNRALVSYRLVKKETLEKAFTEYKLASGKGTGYGYGWMFRQIMGSRTIEHGGAINGYLCNAIYLPAEDVFVAVFSNNTGKSPDAVSAKIAAIAIGKPLSYTEITLPERTLDKYTGVYEDENGNQRMITREGSQLYSQRSGGPKYKIRPSASDRFFFDDSFAIITFTRNASGNVIEAVIDDRGSLSTWTRTDKAITVHIEITPDPWILLRYAGDYELAPGFVITVSVEDGRIYTQATGQSKVEIYPESETGFFLKVVDASLDFVADESGKFNKLILHQGGKDMEGKRITKKPD
ncbi:MAG: serine hydrolase, partial [Bacteroidales bacterium]